MESGRVGMNEPQLKMQEKRLMDLWEGKSDERLLALRCHVFVFV